MKGFIRLVALIYIEWTGDARSLVLAWRAYRCIGFRGPCFRSFVRSRSTFPDGFLHLFGIELCGVLLGVVVPLDSGRWACIEAWTDGARNWMGR